MSASLTLVIVMAVLYACGIYLMLERSMTRVLVGFLLAEGQKRPDLPGRSFSMLLLGIENTAGLRWSDLVVEDGRVAAGALHDALPCAAPGLAVLSCTRSTRTAFRGCAA